MSTDLGNGEPNDYVTKIAIANSNSKYILTAAGSGTVKKSNDGGATWTSLLGLSNRYASHVEFDPQNVDIFYVAYMTTEATGRLYATHDGGSTFTKIDSELPHFPVHVLRVDPGNTQILYAGTDVGLYRSTDRGAHWAKFGTGLPAVSVWDITTLSDGSKNRVVGVERRTSRSRRTSCRSSRRFH